MEMNEKKSTISQLELCVAGEGARSEN